MKSRTSFFNLTALRKDITRFAPVWALYLIGGLLIGLNTVYGYSATSGYGAMALTETIGPLAIVNLLYAIVCGEMLFGDLFNNRLCNALHAFPLRREDWFVTHTVAGLLFSLVPNLILSICFLPIMGDMWYVSFIWLLGMTLEYLFFFSLAAFSAMCTGSRVAMAAVYSLINFLSLIVYWFVMTFYEPLLYGLHIESEDGFNLFCPTAWLISLELVEFDHVELSDFYSFRYTYKGLSADWWYLVVLAVLGAVLLAGAVLLYRRRKLESAGDFVAFRWLKPIFSVVFTLSAGALFEMFGDAFMGVEYVFLAVGIIVGYFVGQMLLQRTVKVFRKLAFLKCAAIGGALLLSIGVTWLDPFGITRWTPEPSRVESVVLSENYYFDPQYDYYNMGPLTVEDPAEIEMLVDIHQLILDEDLPDYYVQTDSIHLTYKMKDGREIVRRYNYRTESEAAEKLDYFFGKPEYVLGYEDWDEFLSEVEYVNLDWFGDGDDDNAFIGQNGAPLLEAIKADCEAGTMVQDRNAGIAHRVQIELGDYKYVGINIYEDCENTISWLEDYFHWSKF